MPTTPVACEEVLLRLLKKKGWYDPDTQRIKADAFIRDRHTDQDGLSVNLRSRTDIVDWVSRWNTSFGVDSLHTGRVHTLHQLAVVQDANDAPDHALITGLPFPDQDAALAERLASKLAEMSRTLDRTTRRRR